MTLKVKRDLFEGAIKPRYWTYKDVKYDEDGWADANKYLPADYDLVYLKIEDQPCVCGWSAGNSWDGLQVKKEDKVLFWKRKFDDNN